MKTKSVQCSGLLKPCQGLPTAVSHAVILKIQHHSVQCSGLLKSCKGLHTTVTQGLLWQGGDQPSREGWIAGAIVFK